MATKPTGNPAGRPPRGHARITEGHYPELYSKWLRGASVHSLAQAYQIDWHTCNHHLQRARMMLRTTMIRERNEVLDELTQVKAAAYACFEKSKRTLTHDEIAKDVDAIAIEKGINPDVASQIVRQTTKATLRDGDPTWLNVVLATIDIEAKLCGHYEAGKREGQRPASKGAYRAAGRSPKETHEVMARRLIDVLTKRREALVGGSN
jgi:hypothetical protein